MNDFERMMIVESDMMRKILPSRYICEPRTYGVFCFDPMRIGLNDDSFVKVVAQKFGNRLQEIDGHEPKTWISFTVYLRKLNNDF